jgi:hypothetical protein
MLLIHFQILRIWILHLGDSMDLAMQKVGI